MQSAEVVLPRFFCDDLNRRKEYRNQLVEKLLVQLTDTNVPEEEVIEERSVLDASVETAIRILQKVERGRQGIERAELAKHLMKQDFKKLEKHRRLQEGTEIAEETEREDAILVIQKYYRGFKGREEIWMRRKSEREFLGFEFAKCGEVYERQKEQREQMKKGQREHLHEFRSALMDAKEGLLENWSEEMKEQMLKERRDWYFSEVDKAEGKWVPTKAAQFNERRDVRLPLNDEEVEALELAEKEKKAAKKNKGKKKKKKKVEEEDKRVEQGPPENLLLMQTQIEKYTKEWDRNDMNFEQKHEESLLKNEVVREVEKQIKGVVDDMINMELFNLKLALKAKKYKYPKKKKKTKKSKKANKGDKPKKDEDEDLFGKEGEEILFEFRQPKKKKKKKYPGDKLTAKKDPRDMLAELIESGIVKKLQPAALIDLIGDPNPLR